MRAWGKWVSEIRIPKTGRRIWLGSYDAPEKAARAYDAAQYCIRGDGGPFNFPANKKPQLPEGSLDSLSKEDIQTIATNFAAGASASSPVAAPATTQVSVNTPASFDFPVSGSCVTKSEVAGEPYFPSTAIEEAANSVENLQLDDFLMLDIEWISDLL